MQFPESWLREFCDPPLSTDALAETLTMGGMEVEALAPVAPPFSGVVVGAVLSTARHPNADRLNVCLVDVGQAEPLTIVCGAPNVRPGIRVPCALVGAALPPPAGKPDAGPLLIRHSALRGVDSQGMLCSGAELGVASDEPGLLVLADDAPVGTDLRRHLRLDDTVFTLKLTPNLGHALSVRGLARELSALTGVPLKTLPAPAAAVVREAQVLPVHIEAPELCGRFTGRVVRGIDPAARTPAWMVDRLARCGQRSVSALVDISNYVMFELGQPSHIFDLDRLHGGLTVRWARADERLKLLNGSTVALGPSVGVIADDAAVESIAGIMGGDATAVSDATRNVYIEAAHWRPEAVAGRARRFKFSTDAGHRFERGVDAAITVEAIERVTGLVLAVCGGSAGPVDDQVAGLPPRPPVTLRVARAACVIGMPLTQADCSGALRRLGFAVEEGEGALTVTPPSWRFDLTIEEDLIEEVARLIGYGCLPEGPPIAALLPRVDSERHRGALALRHRLADLGYTETINFSFVDEDSERLVAGNATPIRLLNPIASALCVLRSSLIASLVDVARQNLPHKLPQVRVFEIGRVYARDAAMADGPFTVAGVAQPMRVAGLALGNAEPLQWGAAERRADFHDVKGDVEALFAPLVPTFVAAAHPALHPGRSARIELGGRTVGHVGELHPRWRQLHGLPSAPTVFELDLDAVQSRPLAAPGPLPRQQSVWRDIALLAPLSVGAAALLQAIEAAPSDGLLRSAQLFDVYKPPQADGETAPGERSWAVRLELRDAAATLTDARIDAAVHSVVDAVGAQLGTRLRA